MSDVGLRRPCRCFTAVAIAITVSCLLAPRATLAQGTVGGVVTSARTQGTLHNVRVAVQGTPITTVTDLRGSYTLTRVPAGERTIVFYWLGFRPTEVTVTVADGETHVIDAALEELPYVLSEVVVEAPSREPERVVDAPAAIAVVEAQALRSISATGQLPMALEHLPGVNVVRSGVHDFNISSRGFNTFLNRRVLVLQDGRDLAYSLLGLQQWNALSLPMEDLSRVEMVRGPGSALYGANAVSGVLNITTPTAREVPGTKVTLAGGELSTFRADVRHAQVLDNGRVGFRLNAGYSRSDTWTRSRTLTDGSSLAVEYAEATDDSVPAGNPTIELVPLSGQRITDGATGTISGDRDPITSAYGSARFDYYADHGAVATLEGGVARTANGVFVNGNERLQLLESWRPWARAAWAHPDYHLMAWWSGQYHPEKIFLGSGVPLEDVSNIYHVEGQHNRRFLDNRARIVVGGSFRQVFLDTKGTTLVGANDDRSDSFLSAYGQLEYRITPELRAVVASRFDQGDIHPAQWSPKAALVLSLSDRHSIRFTVNRAFQTPNYIELFVRAPIAAPVDLSALEAGLRASPLGSALSGVASGELFNPNSSTVPVLAIGNDDLDVEKVTSYELGYKGQLGDRAFVTIDGYYSRLTDFVLLGFPDVNPDFPPWTAPDAVPEPSRGSVEQAVRDAVGPGISRLEDGSTAIVLSAANIGRVDEFGMELAVRVVVTPELQASASYAFFEFDVKEELPAAPLVPNTPKHKGALSLTYRGAQGLDFGVSALLVDSFDWLTGFFRGTVPARQTLNVTAGYVVNPSVRIHAVAINTLNQQRFHVYGGSVIGRRVLAGVTAVF